MPEQRLRVVVTGNLAQTARREEGAYLKGYVTDE
jgi:hypothetical protein